MRVLAIDGGGIRGIIPATVLASLEERCGRPTCELFDLVAGTSTGAILGCALTAPGGRGRPRWRASQLVGLYLEEGPPIFRRSLSRRLATVEGLLEERYDDEALEAALERYLGATHVSDALTRLLVTAYDLPSRTPWFFKSWRADRDAPMRVAARASSAAPTLFEPVELGRLGLVDGGVFAPNPAMCAYAEAVRLTGRPPARLVSLGTGRLTRPISPDEASGWGALEWVRPLLDVVFDGMGATVDYQLERLLGDRHHRLQPDLTVASDDLDDASPENLAALQAQAAALVAAHGDELDALGALL